MNEIEKLYRLAGVEKQVTCSHSGTCYNGSLSECEGCDSYKYPSFTAEKQLNLIKWLAKRPLTIDNVDGEFEFSTGCKLSDFGNFEESLAELISILWQDLTKIEQEGIGNILKEGQGNG